MLEFFHLHIVWIHENLTQKLNAVNVLLHFNASAMAITPSYPISLACGCWMPHLHVVRKISKISPAYPMWSMCRWSSMSLRCRLLLYPRLRCSVNVEFSSFSACSNIKNLTCKPKVVNALLLVNACRIAIAPSSPIWFPYECSFFIFISAQIPHKKQKISPTNAIRSKYCYFSMLRQF